MSRPHQKFSDQLDGTLRGRETDALRFRRCQRRQPFQRQREMCAALVRRKGMDFVHNDGPDSLKQSSAFFGRQEYEEGLGRCH